MYAELTESGELLSGAAVAFPDETTVLRVDDAAVELRRIHDSVGLRRE